MNQTFQTFHKMSNEINLSEFFDEIIYRLIYQFLYGFIISAILYFSFIIVTICLVTAHNFHRRRA